MSDRKAKALVRKAIRISFGGHFSPGLTIRNYTLNGERIPPFTIDQRGRIQLLPHKDGES